MYESYFGFNEKPFQLSPDPRFFFASAHHQRALSYLQYGLDQGEGFIVITGPIGTGKTTIARSLLADIPEQNIVAIQLVTTKLNPEELLELIAAEFKLNIKEHNKANIIQAIEQYLVSLHQQGKRALLLVDEAQNLPSETVEELRMLSNFQLDDKPLIQSFLLGQEELKDIIQAPNMEQFRQRIIASAHLKPLSVDELKDYILHRIKQAGSDNDKLFEPECFTAIHQKTLGVPRKINIFVDRLLLFAFLEELTSITVDAVEQVAEEMSLELTGSLSNGLGNDVAVNNSNPDSTSGLDIATSQQIAHIKAQLKEIEDILESNIKQKVKMTHYIEKLLKQKSTQYAQLSLDPTEESENTSENIKK